MQTKDEDFVTNIFVANTHQPILFFSSTGMVYRLKTYLLPISSPQAKGKALVNLLPLAENEVITTIMPLPADESEWSNLFVIFVTSSGGIRRNELSDFSRINKNGKIAMKPAEGETIISVQTCADDNDILLATQKGQCIRFSVDKVRVFASRSSTGVRGIKLDKGDSVIGMTILNHVDGSNDEFRSYLKASSIMRRAKDGPDDHVDDDESENSAELSTERYAELAAKEEVILTVASNGQGKRTSSYEYRLTNRGGKGVISMMLAKSNADVVSTFPVDQNDQIMLIDDNGQLIRCPVLGIRIMGRNTQGVKIFNIDEKSSVVSVERVAEQDTNIDLDSDEEQDL
jgi:DNA gyrase subunit A